MVKKPDSSFRDILLKIKKREFAPVYILQGEETYFIDKLTSVIEENAIEPADRDFNLDILYGADTDVETVEGSARQFPIMAERRLVVLKEAQAMQMVKNQLDRLEVYFRQPTPTTILVITFKSEKFPFSTKVTKAITEAGGIIFRSPRLREYELDGPIGDYLTEKRLLIEPQAKELLKEYIGNDLSKLFSEIDKLSVAMREGEKRITCEIIEKHIGISKEYNNFELVNALSRREYGKALRIVEFYKKNPKNNPSIVAAATVFGHFQKIIIAHFLPVKTDEKIMEALQLKNRYALSSIKDTMRMFSASQCIQIISFIAEFDCNSKGIESVQNEYDLLKELVFKISSC